MAKVGLTTWGTFGRFALLIGMCLLLSGCWDRVEVQDRSFVLAIAVDLPDEAGAGQTTVENYAHPGLANRFNITLQVLKFGGGKAGEEKPGGETKTYLMGGAGPGAFEAIRDTLGESSKGLWFENIQAILISQAAVERYGISTVIDFWRRDAEMRWRSNVFIVPGEAKKFLEFQPPTGEPGGVYFANLARRQVKDTHVPTARSDMSFVSQAADAGEDMILPVLEMAGKNVKIKGGAVFKGKKLVGFADEYTISGIRMIRGTEKSALISFECPVHPGSTITFELFRHNTILTPRREGDNVYFTLDAALRGNIGEVQCEAQHDTLSVEYQLKVQRMVAEAAKRNIEHSLAWCQSHGVDLIYFQKSLRAYEPKVYAKMEKDWDDVFPTIPMVVSVNVAIINVGEHK